MDYDSAYAAAGALSTLSVVISLALTVVILVAEWKIFTKAGEAGWKILIPFYNNYILFKIIYGNGWKFLLLLVPILNYVVMIAYLVRLAQVFGKGVGFRVLTVFFSPIMLCILGFDGSAYEGPIDSFI